MTSTRLPGRRSDWQFPILRRGEIAEKAFDRMDVDGRIERFAIARAFAGMVADASVHRRQRIVFDEHFPGGAELSRLGKGEPGLDVLSRRAGIVTGGQQVDINRPPGPEGARSFRAARIDERRNVAPLLLHDLPQMGYRRARSPRNVKFASNEPIKSSQSSNSRVIWKPRARSPSLHTRL